MKAMYFIRPTLKNLKILLYEIDKPRFSEYYLCTTKFFFSYP